MEENQFNRAANCQLDKKTRMRLSALYRSLYVFLETQVLSYEIIQEISMVKALLSATDKLIATVLEVSETTISKWDAQHIQRCHMCHVMQIIRLLLGFFDFEIKYLKAKICPQKMTFLDLDMCMRDIVKDAVHLFRQYGYSVDWLNKYLEKDMRLIIDCNHGLRLTLEFIEKPNNGLTKILNQYYEYLISRSQ